MAGRLVLVIDDKWDSEGLVTKERLGRAVREAIPDCQLHLQAFQPSDNGLWKEGPQIHVVGVRDYVEAQRFLTCPELAAVFVDQVFDHPECQLLNPDGEAVKSSSPALQPEQGFFISERLATDLGRLQPPLYMFSSQGQEVTQADRLQQRGVLEGYYSKPGQYEPGDPGFDSLVSFLRRTLNPLGEVKAAESTGQIAQIDPIFLRFLETNHRQWRRDGLAVVDTLLETARENPTRLLDSKVWAATQQRPELKELGSAWDDEELWLELVKPLGACSPWRPWRKGELFDSTSRLHYFKMEREPGRGLQRILIWLDPRAFPAGLTSAEHRKLAKLPVLKKFDSESQSGRPLFRFPLPPRAPLGTLPFLLGTYFEIPDGQWIPLTVFRSQQFREGEPLLPALNQVVSAIDHGVEQNTQHKVPPGYGPVMEGILINRDKHGQGRFSNWRIPLFPLDLLELSPDPATSEPLPFRTYYQLPSVTQWLQAAAAWFAAGALPEILNARQLEETWKELRRLLQGERVDLDIHTWWQDQTENLVERPSAGSRRATKQVPMVQQINRRLRFPLETRCLGEPGSPPRVVRPRVNLVNCELEVGNRSEEPLALLEQLSFQQPVLIRRCRLVDENGQLAPLLIRDCTFEGGLELDQLEAAGIELIGCRFANPESSSSGLAINRTATNQPVVLSRLEASGCLELAETSLSTLTVQGHCGRLKLGPHLRVSQDCRLSVVGAEDRSSQVAMSQTEVAGLLQVECGQGVQFTSDHCRLGRIRLLVQPEAEGVSFDNCSFVGEVAVLGPKVLQAAGGPAEVAVPTDADRVDDENSTGRSSAIPMTWDGCQLNDSLVASGHLAVALRGTRLQKDFICAAATPLVTASRQNAALESRHLETSRSVLASLHMDNVMLSGMLDLSNSRILGRLEMRRSAVEQFVRGEKAHFQEVRVLATSCVGNWLFRESHFHGEVCVAQPGEGTEAETESHGLAGVVLREQIDFSKAHFHAEADFSHLVIEHEAKFQGAIFSGPVDFRRLQCSSNMILSGCTFQQSVWFDGAILSGLLEATECRFAETPSFVRATLSRGVRLSQVCWPVENPLQTGWQLEPPQATSDERPAAEFTDCLVEGHIDLAEPRDSSGEPLETFWVDLTGASADHVGMEARHMRHSFTRSSQDESKRHHPGRRHQLSALAKLFEGSLIGEVRFSEADYFYRKANHYGDHPIISGVLYVIWGHGTFPALAFCWLVALSLMTAGLTIWASDATGRSMSKVILEGFSRFLLGESPPVGTLQAIPVPWVLVDSLIALLVLVQAVLLNLFFVALARRMLR